MGKMKPTSLSIADAQITIARQVRELEEPYRTALAHVSSMLEIAQVLFVAAFGSTATPEHVLTLLDHLLAEAGHVEVTNPEYDEESE